VSWANLQTFFVNKITLWQEIAISLIIVLAFWLLRKVFSRYVFKLFLKILSYTKTQFFNTNILTAFEHPLQFLITVLGFYFALRNLASIMSPTMAAGYELTLNRLLRTFIVVFFAWGFYNLSSASSVIFEKLQSRLDLRFDKIIISILSNTLRILILALTLIVILQEWDYNVNGFLTGLGLGGLAIALAAQDTAANLIGGIAIIVDKPFSIGDWIKTGYGEGTVEDINLRSTRIRTFDQALITIPNSSLAKDAIINYSKMGKRRINFTLKIKDSTPKEKLQAIVAAIKQLLENHPEVHPETILVYFENFEDGYYGIMIYFFTITTVWSEYLAVREEINYKIMDILEKHGVSRAIPTSSVILEKK